MSISHRRTSSHKSVSPLSVVIPPPPHTPMAAALQHPEPSPSPRRHRGRHIPLRDPGNLGLFTVSEEVDNSTLAYDDSRCPSWYSNPPYSPGLSSTDTHVLHTPGSETEDPFDSESLWARSPTDQQPSPEFNTYKVSPTHASRSTRRPALEIDTRPLRSAMRSSSQPNRQPRISSSSSAPYPRTSTTRRALLPALPIVPSRQVEPPSPSLPVTPTTPAQVDGSNLVSALKDLLTSCGEYDEDMFADAQPEDGQFEDAPSPSCSLSPMRLPCLPSTAPRAPVTPMGISQPVTLPPLLPRSPRMRDLITLDSDHAYLQSLAAEARAEHHYPSPTPSISSLPSLSSMGSLSSASSQSISSLASVQGYDSSLGFNFGSVSGSSGSSPPRKRVSSRRPVRGPLPSLWTGNGN